MMRIMMMMMLVVISARGDFHKKGVGMLVVSLRGLNFGFWSHLGCSGKNPLYLAVKVSFRVAREKPLYF